MIFLCRTGIRTLNLQTRVFLPGHYLPFKDLHTYNWLITYHWGDYCAATWTTNMVSGNVTESMHRTSSNNHSYNSLKAHLGHCLWVQLGFRNIEENLARLDSGLPPWAVKRRNNLYRWRHHQLPEDAARQSFETCPAAGPSVASRSPRPDDPDSTPLLRLQIGKIVAAQVQNILLELQLKLALPLTSYLVTYLHKPAHCLVLCLEHFAWVGAEILLFCQLLSDLSSSAVRCLAT